MTCPVNPEGAAAALAILAILIGLGVLRILLAWARKIETS